jgi:CRISPR system Cascade subunit CasA
MAEPYSLAVEAWLPVATNDGKRSFIPIRDIGRADVLRIDTGRADCDISLTEFLIGLLAVTMGPSGTREWVKRYKTPPSPVEIDAAIKPFAHALLLDGPGPRFFQDYDPLAGDEVPVSSLLIEMPGAQAKKDNTDHFVKRGGVDALSRMGAAIALLTLQTCAPAGGAGHRTSLRGGGPATTLVIPRRKNEMPTLWHILWTNVPEGFRIDQCDACKAMPWLAPTRTSEKGEETTEAHAHKAQAFFGMPRRIRLTFAAADGERCALTGDTDNVVVRSYVTRPHGFNYPTTTWKHPNSPYYRAKETSNEWLPLHFKTPAIGYRQWVGMTLRNGNALSRPAETVFTFIENRGREIGIDFAKDQLGILAAGYAMDNMKPLDFTEAMLPLISTSDEERDIHLAVSATAMVQAAEVAASLLLTALKVALYSDRKQGQPDNSSAPLAVSRARFWADTESAFYSTLRGIAANATDDPSGGVYIEAKEGADFHCGCLRCVPASILATTRAGPANAFGAKCAR